jgi:hypothetical protein
MASLRQLIGQGDVHPLKVCSAAMQYGHQIHHGVMACHQTLQLSGVVNVGLKQGDLGLRAQVLRIAQAPGGHGDAPRMGGQVLAKVPPHKAGAAQDQYFLKSINHVVQGKKLWQVS